MGLLYFPTWPCIGRNETEVVICLVIVVFVLIFLNFVQLGKSLSDMETRAKSSCFLGFLLLFLFSSDTPFCYATDTLSASQSLHHNQIIASAEGNFELGFFKPGATSLYYIAIWYKKISIQTAVWVANRNYPLTDPSSSKLTLLEDGNLVILNESKNPIWSTNSISKGVNSSELVLGDDGNLVLRDHLNPSVVFWQSFDHPGDTWLPGAKLRYDNITKSPTLMTSWNNSENPCQGMFSLKIDPDRKQYIILWNGSTTYWTSGDWDGKVFSNVPRNYLKYSYVSNENESYFIYDVYNKSVISRFVMSLSGQVTLLTWMENTVSWNLVWAQPIHQCDIYAFCGAFSTCNRTAIPLCKCFPGFEPRSSTDWDLVDSSDGCARKTLLLCGNKDRFILMPNMKLSENAALLAVESDHDCRLACLNNCSCNGYSYDNGCLIWHGDLLNFQQLYNGDSQGRSLFVRLAASDDLQSFGAKKESGKKVNVVVIFIVTSSVGVLIVSVMMYMRWMIKQRGKKNNDFGDNSELPMFDFETLAIATNNFDLTNKLGKGGFGLVYKGKLSDGREIAVKRLSKCSTQGLEEFKNEVVVISRLQHRNLVRLLGFCIQREEKMLIYEYMHNKSLDSFIFDSTKKALLDWEKRLEIIMGVCRGIIYLHRDSRLRVIHRDLKASNILLDREVKPKISDFGMARIFGANEFQANTSRVVGTYGYMSPEYAMKGVFSEKSDVYSFGVLLLELISGKRNITFHHNEQSLSLLVYAWKLWTEGKTQELIDPVILGSSFQEEIFRCIHVGLLCVQDCAEERPTMPSVLTMLESEIPNIVMPKQPAFCGRQILSDSNLSLENSKTCSKNILSFTTIEGR